MSSRLSKIRSVHTYVMPRTVYFGWICRSRDFKNRLLLSPITCLYWNSSGAIINCRSCKILMTICRLHLSLESYYSVFSSDFYFTVSFRERLKKKEIRTTFKSTIFCGIWNSRPFFRYYVAGKKTAGFQILCHFRFVLYLIRKLLVSGNNISMYWYFVWRNWGKPRQETIYLMNKWILTKVVLFMCLYSCWTLAYMRIAEAVLRVD